LSVNKAKLYLLAKQAFASKGRLIFPFANISTSLKYKPIKKLCFFIGKDSENLGKQALLVFLGQS
jgi:hypothetical protein